MSAAAQSATERRIQKLRDNDHDLSHLAQSLYVRQPVPAFHYAGDLDFQKDIPKLLVVIHRAFDELPDSVRHTDQGNLTRAYLEMLEEAVETLIEETGGLKQ